jgi:hypothetical protein
MTLASSGFLRHLAGGIRDVTSCERLGSHLESVHEELELQVNDIIWLCTPADSIKSLFYVPGILFLALDLSEDFATLDKQSRQLVEAVLDKECALIGHRIGDAGKYRKEYDCPIVAYHAFHGQADDTRGKPTSPTANKEKGRRHRSGLAALNEDGSKQPDTTRTSSTFMRILSGDDLTALVNTAASTEPPKEVGATTETRIAPGDRIIFNAPLTFYNTWRDNSDFVIVREVTSNESQENTRSKHEHAVYSGCILLGLIALVSSSTLELSQAVLLAIGALLATDCTTMDKVVKAVNLRTVLTIVGAFGLGKAVGKERVAEVLADILISALGSFGKRGLLVAVYAATVALGVIFHGTAVVVLMYPICEKVSETMDVPIHQIIAVLCISVSCQMLSPSSYQTNLLAFHADGSGYVFADFPKVGAGLVVSIALVSIPACEYCFPA